MHSFLLFPLAFEIYFVGGGENPKSVSGKVLVAAYWLFVVLMVSTFTSNLAAFLTVERMQATGEGMSKYYVHPC